MSILIIILLIIAGLFLFITEVFLIPGISIAGIVSAVCLLFANYYAFVYLGTIEGVITLLVSSIGCIVIIIWFMRSKMLNKLALKKEINSKVENQAVKHIQIGDQGVSITRLALIGSANFNGHIVEVKSVDGFLDEKTPIVVERIEEGIITVKQLTY